MLDAIADPGGQVFDESFFAFYEDLDVAWRARKLGWTAAYRADAVGYHARGGSSGRAMLGRPPELRYHIAKNRWLTMLRNDTLGGYLANLPFILARDVLVLGALLLTSPGVLLRLGGSRALLDEAVRKRRLDRKRVRNKL